MEIQWQRQEPTFVSSKVCLLNLSCYHMNNYFSQITSYTMALFTSPIVAASTKSCDSTPYDLTKSREPRSSYRYTLAILKLIAH